MQDEVRAIPEDWEETSLGVLGSAFGGLTGKSKADFGRGGARYITFMNVMTNVVIDCGTLESVDVARTETQNRVAQGDLFFNGSSENPEEVGMCAVLMDDVEEVLLNSFCFGFRLRKDAPAEGMYLAYFFRSGEGRELLKSMAQGSTRYNLSKTALLSAHFPLPSAAEQRAIAEALGDADAFIESIEQLLAKKRKLKQGAMQELLSGRRRLPGFSGEWEEKPLGELADVRGGGTPSTSQAQLWDGGVPWCTPTDVTALSGFKYLTSTARTISQQGLSGSSAELIPANSVLMTSRATIGECAINLVPVSTNQGFKNFVPREAVDVEFFYYLLLTQKQGFIKLSAGSTFLEIGKRQLVGYEVRLPATRTEQAAIANVLSDIDAEIVALEAKLTKASALKQGMMQELLTGKIRLG